MTWLVYRHNRITRVTHWVNALVLLILLMSGLQIFNAYPSLHWGSKAEPEEAFFSIEAVNDDGEIRGYTQFYGHRVETTGFLGVQNTDMGPSPRAFPSWLTIPGYFWLAGGRRWHFFFAWLFVINGLFYIGYNAANGHIRKFFFAPRDLKKIFPMILYYFRLRRQSPQEGEYNPLQKMAYTGVFFLLVPLVAISGLAMSPQMDVAFNWLPAMFGGRQSARAFHFILTLLFVLFTFGHIFMVMTTGAINNMRSMITGWYKEKIPASPQHVQIEPAAKEAPVISKAVENEPPVEEQVEPKIPAARTPDAKADAEEKKESAPDEDK